MKEWNGTIFLRTSMQQTKASHPSDIPAIMRAMHQTNDSGPKFSEITSR